MKKLLIIFIGLLGFTALSQAQTGISAAGTAPDASAMLDVIATDKGMLVPRVALVATNNSLLPIASPADGLLVYNTGLGGVATKGFYYWDATNSTWQKVVTGNGTFPTGSGANGYVTYWTGTNTQSYDNTANHHFFWDATNHRLGLGTASPSTRLDLGQAQTNKPLIHFHPGSTSTIDYTGYAHHDFLMGSYVAGGYSQHYISFGYTADVNRKFHIGSAGSSTFDGATTFVPALTVNSGGNVGIGVTGPVASLHIAEKGTGTYMARFGGSVPGQLGSVDIIAGSGTNAFQVWDDNDLVNPRFIVKRGGNVGIGTATPAQKLHVSAAGTAATQQIVGVLESVTSLRPTLLFSKGGGLITSGMSIEYDGTGSGGANKLYVNNISGTPNVTFMSGGNVGIATTTPANTLQIGQNTAANNTDYSLSILRHGVAATPGTYTGSTPALFVQDYSGDGPAALETQGMLQISAPRIADGDANAGNALLLNISNDSGTGFAVTGNRRIGVGTTAPSTQLHTTGGVRFEGVGSTASNTQILTRDASGNLAYRDAGSWTYAGVGDNLGNHTATTHIDLADFQLQNTRAIQGKDWDDDAGGTDNTYRILFRDGAIQMFNGGVTIGGYSNGTWTDLADGTLIVQGNTGIGTTAPAFRLDVVSNSRLGTVETGAWPASTTYAYWGHETLDHSAAGNYALLQHSGGTTYLNSATGAPINFRQNNVDQMNLASHILNFYTPSGNIRGNIHASETLAAGGAGFVIATSGSEHISFKDGGTSGDENMVIRGNTGYIGMGTSNPAEKLEVYGGNVRLTQTSASSNGAIVYRNETAGTTLTDWKLVYRDEFQSSTDSWVLVSGIMNRSAVTPGNNMLTNCCSNTGSHRNSIYKKSFDLTNIPHTYVKVKFTYCFIDSWDGGNEVGSLSAHTADGVGYAIWSMNYDMDNNNPVSSNFFGSASYEDTCVDDEGTFYHTANTLWLRFSSYLGDNPDDESFAIDNVEVWVR